MTRAPVSAREIEEWFARFDFEADVGSEPEWKNITHEPFPDMDADVLAPTAPEFEA